MPTGWVDYNTRTKEQLIELIEMIQRDRYKLEEENRKLKEENKKLSEWKIIYASEKEQRHYVDILEENRKLKDIEAELLKEKKELLDKVKQLEERLDNKEKVNKQLREDIGKFVMKH